MNNQITIAQLTDIPVMVGLLDELFSQDIEFVPNHEKQQTGLDLIVGNPEIGEILVLKKEEKVIGMVSLLYSISTALGAKVAILEDMIISKEYRGQGLGSKLLTEAIRFANERGCMRITLLTDYNNDPAITFYKKFGFSKSAMIPMRRLKLCQDL
jgi:ribosomal protein S18 acetylase RimI-like enzyme